MPARKRPQRTEPEPPEDDVEELVDPEHTDRDFLSDLEKASSDKARKRLGLDPSEPGQESPRK